MRMKRITIKLMSLMLTVALLFNVSVISVRADGADTDETVVSDEIVGEEASPSDAGQVGDEQFDDNSSSSEKQIEDDTELKETTVESSSPSDAEVVGAKRALAKSVMGTTTHKATIDLNGGVAVVNGEEKTGVFYIDSIDDFFSEVYYPILVMTTRQGWILTGWKDQATGEVITGWDLYYENRFVEGMHLTAQWEDAITVSFVRDGNIFYSADLQSGGSLYGFYDDIIKGLGEIDDNHIMNGFVTEGNPNVYKINSKYELPNERHSDTESEKYIYNFTPTEDMTFVADIVEDTREIHSYKFDFADRYYMYWHDYVGEPVTGDFELKVRDGMSLNDISQTVTPRYEGNIGYEFDGFRIAGQGNKLYTEAQINSLIPTQDVTVTGVWHTVTTYKHTFLPGEHGYYSPAYRLYAYTEDDHIYEIHNKGKQPCVHIPDSVDSNEYIFRGWRRDDGKFFPLNADRNGTYTFNFDILDRDVTYTAEWIHVGDPGVDNRVRVIFDLKGGYFEEYADCIKKDNCGIFYIPKGSDCYFISLGRNGYTFAGWKIVEGEDVGRVLTSYNMSYYNFNADTRLEAQWINRSKPSGWIEDEDGWYCYKDGQLFTENKVLVQGNVNNMAGWYVSTNGKFDSNFSGIAKATNGAWYYAKNGVLDRSFTGKIALATNGVWYYVTDGKIDKSFNGIALATNGVWYYVSNGKIDKSFNGIAKATNGIWYYVSAGKINKTYAGVAKTTSGVWYYVSNGKIDKTFNGIARATDGNWYYMVSGKIDKTFNGIAKATNGAWYYVKSGTINKTYIGVAKTTTGVLYYVKNSKIDKTFTGIAKGTDNKSYYVKAGKVDKTFTGNYKYNGKTYKIVKGVAQ